MSLEPLLAAPLPIQVHAIAALSALALVIFQLAAPNEASSHQHQHQPNSACMEIDIDLRPAK